jgi:RNA polymerase sigma-70 factor (ECF subfamily)
MSVTTTEVWEGFRHSLRQFIAKRVQDEDDAEDILQDVFLKIHDNIDKFRDDTKIKSWVYQITRNAIIDHYRARKVTAETPEIPGKIADEPAAESDLESEIASCLKPLLGQLPEKYSQAIALTELQGITQKEMAKDLGLSVSGAKARVQRARKKLKEALTACCHFEFDRRGNILDYQPKEESCPCCAENPSNE